MRNVMQNGLLGFAQDEQLRRRYTKDPPRMMMKPQSGISSFFLPSVILLLVHEDVKETRDDIVQRTRGKEGTGTRQVK